MKKIASMLVMAAAVTTYSATANAGTLPSLPSFTAPTAPVYTPPSRPATITPPAMSSASAFFAKNHHK